MPSKALDQVYQQLAREIDTNSSRIDQLTKRTEIAGKAFSAPISTEADAPLAADGMNIPAFRFIDDVLHYYRADIDAWATVGEWNYISSDLNIAGLLTEFDITDISQVWDEWKLTLFLRSNTASTIDQLLLRLNGNTTAGNYASQYDFGSGATAGAARDTTNATLANIYTTAANCLANAFTVATIQLMNVVDTSKLTQAEYSWTWLGATVGTVSSQSGHGVFALTDAINRIQVVPTSGLWIAGSGYLLEGKKYR